MLYKVVPFTATMDKKKDTTAVVAAQLESLVRKFAGQGWAYVRLESVSTYVQPDTGCFGFGGKPGYMASYQMVVFSRLDNEVVAPVGD